MDDAFFYQKGGEIGDPASATGIFNEAFSKPAYSAGEGIAEPGFALSQVEADHTDLQQALDMPDNTAFAAIRIPV
jgi:hypothetical protein